MTDTTLTTLRPRIAAGDWPLDRAAAADLFTNPRRKVHTPPLELLPERVVAAVQSHDTAMALAHEATAKADDLRRELEQAQSDHVTEADAALRAGRKTPSDKPMMDLAEKLSGADAAAATAWEVRGQRAADVFAAAVEIRADHLAGHAARMDGYRSTLAGLFDAARSTLAAMRAEATAAAWIDTASTAWKPAGARRSDLTQPRFKVPTQLGSRVPRSPVEALDLAEQCITHWLGPEPAPTRVRPQFIELDDDEHREPAWDPETR